MNKGQGILKASENLINSKDVIVFNIRYSKKETLQYFKSKY
jgi:hypothetical protein